MVKELTNITKTVGSTQELTLSSSKDTVHGRKCYGDPVCGRVPDRQWPSSFGDPLLVMEVVRVSLTLLPGSLTT